MFERKLENAINYDDLCAILDEDAAAGIMEKLKSLEYKKLKAKVLEVHKNKIFPKYDSARGTTRYQTRYNGKIISRASEEELVYTLAEKYHISLSKGTVEEAFELGLTEVCSAKKNSQNTLNKSQRSYRRFITAKLAKMPVSEVSGAFLTDYTHELIARMEKSKFPMNKKAFLAYKGVLNIIFEYACTHHLITSNPVLEMEPNSIFVKSLAKPCVAPDEETEIFSLEEIEEIKATVRENAKLPLLNRMDGYYVNGYVILLSIETGMRIAELCALKWSDIKSNYIWIHSQQLIERTPAGEPNRVYDVAWTKNEKLHEGKGRMFPLWKNIRALLEEIKAEQNRLGITSEYVFAHKDGNPINKESYHKFLTEFCRYLGFTVTNNHAFRKTLNSLVFTPKGIQVQDRAAMLGHSVETNLKYYTKTTGDYVEELLKLEENE